MPKVMVSLRFIFFNIIDRIPQLLSACYFGGLGILGTSNFRATLELFFSVFQDELLILR